MARFKVIKTTDDNYELRDADQSTTIKTYQKQPDIPDDCVDALIDHLGVGKPTADFLLAVHSDGIAYRDDSD